MTTTTRTTIRGTDAVADAARTIPYDIYLGPDGDAVEPIIARTTTWRDLRSLDLRANMRVLEIGTGSGYSAALMGHIVRPNGHVVTIDADPVLAARAGRLLATHGHRAIAATGTGLGGHRDLAPYDRIYVPATPAAIPGAWLDQLDRGGVLVTGCTISDLPGSYAVAHITKTFHDDYTVTVHAGRYPLMGPPLLPAHVTAVTAPDYPGYYLASTHSDTRTSAELLDQLRHGTAQPWPGTPGEFLDLKHWLLARRPAGLFTSHTEFGDGIGIGARSPASNGLATRTSGPAEAAMITPAHLVASPTTSPTAARFLDLIAEWRAEGPRATHELEAVLQPHGSSYQVRLDD